MTSSFGYDLFILEDIMREYLPTIIWGVILFIGVFLINYFIIFKNGYKNINKKKKKKTLEQFVGFSYLVPKFNLNIEKLNINYIFVVSSLINAFIISTVCTVIYIIPWAYPFRMLLGFVLLFALIYACYELFGRYLVKKGSKKKDE